MENINIKSTQRKIIEKEKKNKENPGSSFFVFGKGKNGQINIYCFYIKSVNLNISGTCHETFNRVKSKHEGDLTQSFRQNQL